MEALLARPEYQAQYMKIAKRPSKKRTLQSITIMHCIRHPPQDGCIYGVPSHAEAWRNLAQGS